jgi:hypothetical protein
MAYVRRTRKKLYWHRELAEAALGKPLPEKAVVHHVDHDTLNKSPRLVICEDQAYHMLLHRRERVVKAGGNPNTDKICSLCKRVLSKDAFGGHSKMSDGLQMACRACLRVHANRRKQKPLEKAA